MAKFNFYITTYNTPKNLIDKAIDSIQESINISGEPNLFSILIIDDASSKYEGKLTPVITNESNKNRYESRRRIVKYIHDNFGEDSYCIQVDSDDKISYDFCCNLLQAYSKDKDCDIYDNVLVTETLDRSILSLPDLWKFPYISKTRIGLAGRVIKLRLMKSFIDKQFDEEISYGEDLVMRLLMNRQIDKIHNFKVCGFSGIYHYDYKRPEQDYSKLAYDALVNIDKNDAGLAHQFKLYYMDKISYKECNRIYVFINLGIDSIIDNMKYNLVSPSDLLISCNSIDSSNYSHLPNKFRLMDTYLTYDVSKSYKLVRDKIKYIYDNNKDRRINVTLFSRYVEFSNFDGDIVDFLFSINKHLYLGGIR